MPFEFATDLNLSFQSSDSSSLEAFIPDRTVKLGNLTKIAMIRN